MTVREQFRRLRAEQWALDPSPIVVIDRIFAERHHTRPFRDFHRAVCFGHIRVAPIVAPDYTGPWADPTYLYSPGYLAVRTLMREAL